MSHEFRKREEEEELIKRYEDNLRANTVGYFDIEAYEVIIDHYMEKLKFKKALVAA